MTTTIRLYHKMDSILIDSNLLTTGTIELSGVPDINSIQLNLENSDNELIWKYVLTNNTIQLSNEFLETLNDFIGETIQINYVENPPIIESIEEYSQDFDVTNWEQE